MSGFLKVLFAFRKVRVPAAIYPQLVSAAGGQRRQPSSDFVFSTTRTTLFFQLGTYDPHLGAALKAPHSEVHARSEDFKGIAPAGVFFFGARRYRPTLSFKGILVSVSVFRFSRAGRVSAAVESYRRTGFRCSEKVFRPSKSRVPLRQSVPAVKKQRRSSGNSVRAEAK